MHVPEGKPGEVIYRSAAQFKRAIIAGRKPGHQAVVHLLFTRHRCSQEDRSQPVERMNQVKLCSI